MLQFIAIIIMVWLIWRIFGQRIQAWLARRLMQRMARTAARQAGIDPDFFTGRSSGRGAADRRSSDKEKTRQSFSQQRRRTPPPDSSGPLIPKEYAEDVEYTEIRNYSSETVISGEGVTHEKASTRSFFFRKGKETLETQVSDAEIISITKD